MLISQLRNFSSAWSPLQKTFLYQEWLVYFFQRSGILPKCRSNRCQSYRTSLELINNGTKYLIVYLIQSVTVNIQRFQCISSYFHINPSGTFHLSKITYTT